jgi:hypothetical protein
VKNITPSEGIRYVHAPLLSFVLWPRALLLRIYAGALPPGDETFAPDLLNFLATKFVKGK